MNRLKAIHEKLKSIKGLPLALIYAAAVVSIALSLVLVLTENSLSFLAYAVFVIAALTLAYSVYTLVIFAPKIKHNVIKLLEKRKFTRNLLLNYGYRALVFATISFVINIGYAVFLGILGVKYSSVWYGALAGYYITLSLIRGNILFLDKKTKKETSLRSNNVRAKIYRNTGGALILLTLALSVAVVQMVLSQKFFEKFGDIMIFGSAAYAFYRISLASYNFIRQQSIRIY